MTEIQTTKENESSESNIMDDGITPELIEQAFLSFSSLFSNVSLPSVKEFTGMFSSIFKEIQGFVTGVASFLSNLMDKVRLGFSICQEESFGTGNSEVDKDHLFKIFIDEMVIGVMNFILGEQKTKVKHKGIFMKSVGGNSYNDMIVDNIDKAILLSAGEAIAKCILEERETKAAEVSAHERIFEETLIQSRNQEKTENKSASL